MLSRMKCTKPLKLLFILQSNRYRMLQYLLLHFGSLSLLSLSLAAFTTANPFSSSSSSSSSLASCSSRGSGLCSINLLPEKKYCQYRNVYYNLHYDKVVRETVNHYNNEVNKRFEKATLQNIESGSIKDKEFKRVYKQTREKADRMIEGMKFSLQEYLKLKSHIEKYALYNKVVGNLGEDHNGYKISLDDNNPSNWLQTFPNLSLFFHHSEKGIKKYINKIQYSQFNYPYVGITRDFSPFNEHNQQENDKKNIPYQDELFVRKEGYNSDYGLYKLQQRRILLGKGEGVYRENVKRLQNWSLLNYPGKANVLLPSFMSGKWENQDQFQNFQNIRNSQLHWIIFMEHKIKEKQAWKDAAAAAKENNQIKLKEKNKIIKSDQTPNKTVGNIVLSRISCMGGLIHTLNPLRKVMDEEKYLRRKRIHTVILSTLQGHLIAGEERFCIIHDRKKDEVYFDMTSFSKPNGLWGTLVTPYIRLLQRQFFHDMEEKLTYNNTLRNT